MRRLWWSSVGIVALLAFPVAVSATSSAERVVSIDPPTPVPGGAIVITVTGWPEACAAVDLAYLDGSVGGRDQGDVLGSWGSLELVDGAGTTTVTAPGPEEYNLRVSGPVETCGEPYYSPDFFVETPPPPDPLGEIDVRWLTVDAERFEVLAEGWPDACPSLDVMVVGETESKDMGAIELDGGNGSISAPAAALADIEPYEEALWWDVVATGPLDRCGGSYITELLVPRSWPPTPVPTTVAVPPESTNSTTPSVDPAATVTPSADGGLPSTGGSVQVGTLVAVVLALSGGVLLAVSRRRSA